MAESQIPKVSNPNTGRTLSLVIPLAAIGMIVVLIILIYNGLFPKAYWQSRDLDQNQAKWESQNINNYQISVTFLGYASYGIHMPFRAEVKDGKVISLVDSVGNNVTPADIPDTRFRYSDSFTIQGLFSYAHRKIWEKPPVIDISYDPTFGYPEEIYVDPYVEPCCQDYTIEIQDFQVLP